MHSKGETPPAPEESLEKSGYADGVFYLTNAELIRMIKGCGFRWSREGYINLQGGIDATANEFRSSNLGGKTIKKLVLVSLNPKLAAQLRHLDLSYNPELTLVEPRDQVKALVNLKFLEVKYSRQEEVPIWIKDLPGLEALLMGGNSVKKLPSWVTEKQGMKVVSLFMNELEEVESYGEIEELNIGSNKSLRTIPALQPNAKLKDLEAERCDLQALPENLFSGDMVKCVVNHNPGLSVAGVNGIPAAPRDTNLKIFSATFCGFAEVPMSLIRPEMFVKI